MAGKPDKQQAIWMAGKPDRQQQASWMAGKPDKQQASWTSRIRHTHFLYIAISTTVQHSGPYRTVFNPYTQHIQYSHTNIQNNIHWHTFEDTYEQCTCTYNHTHTHTHTHILSLLLTWSATHTHMTETQHTHTHRHPHTQTRSQAPT